MDTSASLLQRVREQGDDADWQRLVRLYTPLIRTWLSRHIRQADDVNDLVQQIFMVVMSKLPDFVHNGRAGAFRHWLKSITVNTVRAFWRARRLPSGPADAEEVLEQLTDPASELSRQWDREHDCYVAHKVLDHVEPEFRPATWQAFCRLVLDEAAPETVAVELGLSTNAVLIAKSRVLRRLRQEVKGLLD
jgi:RNA polymerase sigma-70 factor (ECF subfamily)